MSPYYADDWLTIYQGDCRTVLPELAADSVDCVVTSPPYWGLRDYGSDGQLGLEPTPEEYVANLVAVFREVRRVLKPSGTCWLNLGDSYNGVGRGEKANGLQVAARVTTQTTVRGLKPKDLVGIPWLVARALQEPYYTGRIPRERDRVWLAAMIDGEGTICGFDHDRADGNGHRSGVHVAITNTSTALLDEAARIWPTSRSLHQRPHAGHLGTKDSWRWIVHGIENKMAALADIYPHLIAKRQQAVVAYHLLGLMANAKRLGHSPQKDAVLARRRVLTGLLSDLNHQRPVTMPSWLIEPPSLFEPGWYLRSDIIWAKPNPMPESVTDRPTKAHEYLFLLTKSARYFFDADAVREPHSDARPLTPSPTQASVPNRGTNPGMNGKNLGVLGNPAGRNLRSVWYDLGDENLPNVPAVASRVGVLPTPGSSLWTMPEVLGGESDGMAAVASSAGEDTPSESPIRPDGGRPGAPEGAREVGAAPTADGGLQGVGSGEGSPAASEPVRGGQGSGGSVLRFEEGQDGPTSEAADAAREGERREVQAQAPDAIGGRVHDDGCRMGEHQGGAVGCVCVLPDGSPADDGSLPAAESRRVAHPGECCGCVSPLQQQQEGADRGGVDRSGLTDLWTIATKPYKGAHFAVFPPELPERCIKAGSSERGVCPECGAPWERVVERASAPPEVFTERHAPTDGFVKNGMRLNGTMLGAGQKLQDWRDANPPQTTGWQPTCRHPLKPQPAVVLDPFAGSGTVGLVANRLNRRAVLIDLNPEYLRQQMARNAQTPLGLGA